MTLAQCISFVDGIEPNAYTNEQKARWVSECEGRVWTDVFLQSPADFTPLTYSANASDELSVKAPHDKIYDRYLRAMIHYANNEPDRYAMSYTLFNDAWGEFVRWFARNYDPAYYVDRPDEAEGYEYPAGYFEGPTQPVDISEPVVYPGAEGEGD